MGGESKAPESVPETNEHARKSGDTTEQTGGGQGVEMGVKDVLGGRAILRAPSH